MKMKNRGSAIIPYNDGIILIKRIKGIGESKKEYYTIPGGGQEEGETIEEATLREIKEELGIEIELTNKCYELENQNRHEYFYISKYIKGEIGTGIGEEMISSDYEKYGFHIPEIVPKKEIKNINLLPEYIKNTILTDMNKIF